MAEAVTIQEIALLLKSKGFIKEANLLIKIHREVPNGRILLVTRKGRIERVEREIAYDDLLSDGL